MAKTLKEWLLGKNQRLENYGYDYPHFRKMSVFKSKMKKKVAGQSDADIRRSLAKAGILGKGRRLTIAPVQKRVKKKSGKVKYVRTGGKRWEYTTGQSYNEEFINMLTIAGTKGKKSFWDVQNNWW